MARDNGGVIAHYSKMYDRLFRYGPILTGFIVASILSFFLLRGQPEFQPTVIAQDDDIGVVQDDPKDTDNNSDTKDAATGTDTKEPWVDSIAYKNTNYNLDALIKTFPTWQEGKRKHTDEHTIISESTLSFEENTKNFTATIDHSSGINFTFLQISTDYDDINEKINTLMAENSTTATKVIETLQSEFQSKIDTESSCLTIQEQLASYGEIECNEGFVHVKIINKNYQRSYFFHHKDFALQRIETSDSFETKALSDITNIDTDSLTIAQVINRILEKRLTGSSVPDPEPELETPSLEVSQTFEKQLGVTPTTISEKNGSFGVNFTLNNINFFGIYNNQEQIINGLLFTDVVTNGKPLSIPSFSLNFKDTGATQQFKQDPLEFLEGIKAGITSLYSSSKA